MHTYEIKITADNHEIIMSFSIYYRHIEGIIFMSNVPDNFQSYLQSANIFHF